MIRPMSYLLLLLIASSLHADVDRAAVYLPRPALLEAQVTEIISERREIIARGAVHFNYRDVDLFCDELRASLEADEVEARGNVRVTRGPWKVTGTHFRYRMSTKEGFVDKAKVNVEGFEFQGEQILVFGDRVVVKNAQATPCRAPRPHFAIHSGEVEIRAGKDVTFRQSHLVLGGSRVLPLPRYTTSLAKSTGLYQSQGLTPVFFVNGRDGLFLGGRYEYQFDGGPNHLTGALDFGQSAVRGPRGGPELAYHNRDFNLTVRSKFRDTVDYHFDPNLLVDVRPEFLAQSRAVTVAPNLLGIYGGVSYGFFRELPSRQTDTRRLFYLNLDSRSEKPRSKHFGQIFFRHADYDKANTALTVYGIELGTRGRLSRALVGDFSLVWQEVEGRSGFRFDEVLIARELRADFDYRVHRNWILPILLRYDLDRNSVRDKRLGLMRAYDCVAYGMSFDTARREFRFEGRFLLNRKYR